MNNKNPEVPGLMYKFYPMDEKMRKLSKDRKLWEGILELSNVKVVFTGESVIINEYDVDIFIPWSCLMNDGLWNSETEFKEILNKNM